MLERIKTFLNCFFVRKVKPQGKLSEADVIGAFSLGFLKNDPGLSNEVMARFVEKLFNIHQLHIISQWEITDAMRVTLIPIKNIHEHRIKGKYLDTLEVAAQMVEEMKKQGWKKIVVVAHPLHVWRCVKILQKLGVEPIIPARLKTIPFDPRSEQWWTRNRILWTIKEIPIRLGSFVKGWI